MSVADKRAEAKAAKASLFANLDALKARLAPSTLVSDAVESAREKAIDVAEQTVETVRARPLLSGSVAGGVALFFGRKHLCSLIRRLTGSRQAITHSTEGTSS